jgi:hypothetical protein
MDLVDPVAAFKDESDMMVTHVALKELEEKAEQLKASQKVKRGGKK